MIVKGKRRKDRAKHRITMASLPVSSHVANAKLPYAGRHMNTHKRAHTQRQYTEAWSHAYRCIQCNIQCNILVTRCTWSDPFTLNHQSLLMVSMFSGCHWLDKSDHNNNDLKPWWQWYTWLDRVDVGHYFGPNNECSVQYQKDFKQWSSYFKAQGINNNYIGWTGW